MSLSQATAPSPHQIESALPVPVAEPDATRGDTAASPAERPSFGLRLVLGAALLAPLILVLLSLLAGAVLFRSHVPADATGTTTRLWAGRDAGARPVSSGAPLTLRWTVQHDADHYRVQIAMDGSGFSHPVLQTDLRSRSYTVELPGDADYAVRVQPHVSGAWLPFSTPLRVHVARPALRAPILRSPDAVSDRSRVHLCWSSVPNAASYVLHVSGRVPVYTTATCHAMTLTPGSYHWMVAPVAQGFRSYTGPFSHSRALTVAVPTPTPVLAAPPPAVQAPALQSAPAVPAPIQVTAPQPAAPQAPASQPPAPAPTPAQAQPTAPSGPSSSTCIPFVSC